jgi:hypothetical protein
VRSLALALVVLVLAAKPTRADDAPVLPAEPFAKAAVGDWESFTVALHVVADGERRLKQSPMSYKITEVAADTATVQVNLGPNDRKPIVLSRNEPRVDALMVFPGSAISNVSVADEKRTAAGRELACKRIQLTSTKKIELESVPTITLTEVHTLWFSAELPAPGLVAYVTDTHSTGGYIADSDLHGEAALAGYGRAGAVEWGKRLEELPTSDEKDAPPPPTPLALNPYEDAAVGDWHALSLEMTTKSHVMQVERLPIDETKVERHLLVRTIAKVTDDVVSIAAEDRAEDGKVTKKTFDVKRREPPSLEDFFSFHPGEILKSKQTDDPCTLEGKTFAAKKVVFESDCYFPIGTKDHSKWGRLHGTERAWVSNEVKGRVLVRAVSDLEGTGFDGTLHVHAEFTLVGFGDADHVLFGKKPEPVGAK